MLHRVLGIGGIMAGKALWRAQHFPALGALGGVETPGKPAAPWPP